ncbi:MAG: SEL1-like repeat protein, partial [Pseudomonadota bacterium]
TVGSDVFLYEAYAYIYSNGDGVPKDDVKAKRYAKQATELKKEIQKEKERVWAEFSTPDPRQPSQRVAATSANNSAASKIGDAVVEEMVQYGTRSVLEYFFGGKN